MIEWALSFVAWWAWGLVGLAAAGAAWTYLGARAGLGVLVGMALWAAYLGGVASERERGEAAGLKAELAVARDDIAKARKAEQDASKRAADIEQSAKANQDIVNAIERSYPPEEPVPEAPVIVHANPADGAPVAPPALPRACRCNATADDLRRLRELR